MNTSFSGHSGGDAISTVRNSRFRRNQTLENHLDCAKLLNIAESNTKVLYNKILAMSPKHNDSNVNVCKLLKDFALLRNALDSEIHSQIKIPNGADDSYLDNVYSSTPTATSSSSSPSTDKWD
jgi:hypothetical protein